jgi:50S ribosomal subunit-associated GTPase HflX
MLSKNDLEKKMSAPQKNAILLSLDDSNAEIVQLAQTLGYTIVKEFIQHREQPNRHATRDHNR